MSNPTTPTSTVDNATLPEASTSEKLYYVRCKRDGSWLSAESATFRLVPNVGNPARLSLMHANVQFGCDHDGNAYEAIDITKPLHSYVTDWLKERGPLNFDALFRHVKAYCPFELQRFEMSAMLNAMLRRGEIQLEPIGLAFMPGDHSNDCAVCGSELESHGDCSNKHCTTHLAEHGGYDCHCIRCDFAQALAEGRAALNGDSNDAEHDALLTLVGLLEQNTKIPGLFVNELSEQLTTAVFNVDQAILGNGDIVASATALVELLRENAMPHGSEEPQIIRVFLDGGLVQEVTGIREGQAVRVIDLDVEGSTTAAPLGADDMPPWMTDDYAREHGPKRVDACVQTWDTFAGKGGE